jgi:periplasmic divalent cation tolerance protein
MEPVSFVYMTAGNREEALAIGKSLVSKKLAACINVIDQMTSVFEWEGEVQQDSETVLIAKTAASRVPELIEAVKAQHSYDCPCIVCLPLTGGNSDFLEWIASSVTPAQ